MSSSIPPDLDRFSVYQGLNKRILITGGTGFIGSRLTSVLEYAGCEVTILTRSDPEVEPTCPTRFISTLDQVASDECFDVIINLAGEPLAGGRWNARRKQAFIDSRVSTTQNLQALIERSDSRPELLINGSAIGFYGPHGDELLDEDGAITAGFSHELCRQWEEAAIAIGAFGVRVCRLRIGVVLGREGGPYQQLSLPFRLFASVGMGNGSQWVSWIHRDDLIGMMLMMMTHPELNGAFNGTAPTPVTNDQLCENLRAHFRTLIRFRMPAAVMKMILGEMAEEILLTGQRVIPKRFLDTGYQFFFTGLDEAIEDLETQ